MNKLDKTILYYGAGSDLSCAWQKDTKKLICIDPCGFHQYLFKNRIIERSSKIETNGKIHTFHFSDGRILEYHEHTYDTNFEINKDDKYELFISGYINPYLLKDIANNITKIYMQQSANDNNIFNSIIYKDFADKIQFINYDCYGKEDIFDGYVRCENYNVNNNCPKEIKQHYILFLPHTCSSEDWKICDDNPIDTDCPQCWHLYATTYPDEVEKMDKIMEKHKEEGKDEDEKIYLFLKQYRKVEDNISIEDFAKTYNL